MSCSSDKDVTDNVENKSYDSSVINPDYVPVNWNNTKVYEYDPSNGIFSFASNTQTEKIVPGSVLTIDVDTMGYIVIAKTVSKSNNAITITSEKGSLCDIFANCKYTLSSQEATNVTRSLLTNTVYPSLVLVKKDNGDWNSLTTTRANSNGSHLTGDLWNWEYSLDNDVLFSTNHSKIFLKEANFGVDIDLNMDLSFGGRSYVSAYNQAYRQYRSQALGVTGTISGKFSSNCVIQGEVNGKSTIAESEDERWKHNIFKPIRIKFTIPAGEILVPVYITLSSDLFCGASLDMEGQITAHTGFHSNINGELGFQWNQTNGISPIKSLEMNNEVVYPTIEGKGKLVGKTWLYPRIYVTLYGILGPSFDIKPYLGCELDGGFREQLLSSSNDYCAWQLRSYAGLKANAGLSLMFMNYETKRFNTDDLQIIEKDLYKSPTEIKFYKAQHETVTAGVQNRVNFKVFDTNCILNKSVETPLRQIVKFEGNGSLSSKYGIAKDGVVSVNWTPASNSDQIRATLYDANGDSIKSVSWGNTSEEQNLCPDENHPHMIDLGLPSGTKWACCNVGATTPEGFGGYYAWGETTTKSNYSSETYLLGNYSMDGDYSIYSAVVNIGSNIAGTSNDAATANWGNPWRMPTYNDFKELNSKCTWEWTEFQNVKGMKVTGLNGRKIFLPAVGGRHGSELSSVNSWGCYWSATLVDINSRHLSGYAYSLGFSIGAIQDGFYLARLYGQSVRPVCP